ncbi:hypothetical protein ACS0TY_023411 [Phlomoides rotata]
MCALKDLVVKGNKCDNGFKNGYLLLLENSLAIKFSGTDLKCEPHINSKIHIWKRQYVCLKNLLGISDVGLNSTTYHVEALPEVWESQIKVDSFTKSLKNKAFFFYLQWGEIFGNDCANGQSSQLYADAVQEIKHHSYKQPLSAMDVDEQGDSVAANQTYNTEKVSFTVDDSSSTPKSKEKGSKRKYAEGVERAFIDMMGNYCDNSNENFGQIAETMGKIMKRVGREYDNRVRHEQVYDALGAIEFMIVEARVKVAQYLCNNSKDMNLFFSLSDDAKSVLVTRIMQKLALN